MGTRNLTIVFADGEYRVAQYGQWDGYPGGQGLTALRFVRDKLAKGIFLGNLRKCRFISHEEQQRRYKELGADDSGWVNVDISRKFKQQWPTLNRDMGAEVLEAIQNAREGLDLSNGIAFASDSLMCEWAYVVDFDKNTFEVYKGFNQHPVPKGERFADFPLDDYKSVDQYYPITSAGSWHLGALPSDDEFMEALLGREEVG